MQGNRNTLCFHVPGTLAANLNIRWTAPVDGRIKHVSAVGSNANDGLLTIGVSSDTDEILASASIGDSDTPVEFDVDNWATTNPTAAFAKGDILVIILDYDGAGGTATDDFTLILTILEG